MQMQRSYGSLAMLLAFCLSGYASLSYEMSWVRQLVMTLGVTYFAITTILTAFMSGLALGAVIAGRLVDRMRIPPLLAFAGLEIFLGVYAQLFAGLTSLVDTTYIGLVQGAEMSFASHAVLRIIFAVAVLAPPTLASGATLPVASRAFITGDASIGRGVAALYGANVVGATLGCFATTFFVIGLLGYPATAWIGTGANLIAAAIAVLLHRRAPPPPTPAPSPVAPASARNGTTIWLPGAAMVGMAYFAVGFASMGSELLWTRVLSQFGFNPATLVFGLVLTTYLVGHAIGSLAFFPLAIRHVEPRRLFTLLLLGFAALLTASVAALTIRFDGYTVIGPLRQLGLVLPWERTWLLIPGLLLPATCTGILMPLTSHLSIKTTEGIGTGVGSLAALSTVGGILGSVLTGFWLMPALGAVPCMLLMAGWCAVTATWSHWALQEKRGGMARPAVVAAVLTAGFAGLVALVPPHTHLILFPGEEIIAFSEGVNASSAIVDTAQGDRVLLVSGERVFGGGSDVPLAMSLNPTATRAAIIGLGSGSVTAVALADDRLEQVVAIDIDSGLPKLLPLLLRERWELFGRPGFTFEENDGRHFLRTSSDRYDLLVNDAAIYAWYLELSTLEFNLLARSKLEPEGLYLGRLHLFRITDHAFKAEIRTFLEVFPNAAFWEISEDIGILIGRNGELPVDRPPAGAPLPDGRVLWYNAEELHEIAKGGRLISDQHPLHVPWTFTTTDRQPIIEYTDPSLLPTPNPRVPPPMH